MENLEKTTQTRKTNIPGSRGPLAAALVFMLLATAIPVAADHEPWHVPETPIEAVLEPADAILVPFIRKCERVDEDDVLDPWYTLLTEIHLAAPFFWFGKVPCWEYGDAPDSSGNTTLYPTGYPFGSAHGWFPTTSDTQNTMFPGQPGARHQYTDVAWLGDIDSGKDLADCEDTPSRESDADRFPTEDTVRNLNPYTLTPDEDTHDNGLHPAYLPAGSVTPITVRVSACEDIERWFVNVLIDWNFNGRWDGYSMTGSVSEWAVYNAPVGLPGGTTQDFSFPIATGVVPGKPWVRVTLTERPIEGEGDLGWDGSVPPGHFDDQQRPGFLYGETEDHCGPLQTFRSDEVERDHSPCVEREG